MKLSEIAAALGLTCGRDAEVQSLGFIGRSAKATLTFAEDAHFGARAAADGAIAGVVAGAEAADAVGAHQGLIVSAAPKRDFYRIHAWLAAETDFYGGPAGPARISPSARIHESAVIAATGVEIGAESVVEARAVIQSGTVIGERCIIRAGCVVGGQGFEFKPWDGRILAVPHTGGVRLGREVELQQGCMVDRALFGGFTEIGDESKLDNLVHVAHNCRIGKRCLIAASAVVAGSVTLDDDVWIGPGAVISSCINIGARASIAVGSVIVKDVAAGVRAVGRALGHYEQSV